MQILSCSGALGNCCNDNSMMVILDIAKRIFDVIQIVAPILLIIGASIQLIKLTINPEEKNGLKRIKNMVIAAIIIFMIPVVVNAVLGLLPDSFSLSSCWSAAKKRAELAGSTMTQYADPYGTNRKKSSLVSDPSIYENGNKNDTSTGDTGNISTSSSSSTNSSSTSTNSSATSNTNQTGTVSGKDVIAYAKQFKGKQYVRGGYWNGELPYQPTDCVGFVKGVYKHFGISIPSNTSSIYKNKNKFTVVTGQPVQPGDIVIYAHHRALITGNGNQVIHAMGEAYGIGYSKNYKSCGAGSVVAVVRVNAVYN